MKSHDPGETPDPIGSDLRELFRAGAPAEPSDAEWSQALERIHRAVSRPQVTPVPAVRRWRLGILVAASLAAAAAIALAVVIPSLRNAAGTADQHVDVEYPVTDAADVEIISMDAADSGAIVVGDLPLRKPIVFMEPGDVSFRSIERSAEGEFPDVHMHKEDDQSPMIWTPLSVKP
jgi:hypothetical protein